MQQLVSGGKALMTKAVEYIKSQVLRKSEMLKLVSD